MSQPPQERETRSSQSPQTSGRLSQHDPDVASGNRPPGLLIIIVVLLVSGVVVLHLTGVLGP